MKQDRKFQIFLLFFMAATAAMFLSFNCGTQERTVVRTPTCEDLGKPGEQPAVALFVDECTGEPTDVETLTVTRDGVTRIIDKTIGAKVGEYPIDCIQFGVQYTATINLEGYEGYDEEPFVLNSAAITIPLTPDEGCEDPADLTPVMALQKCINDASPYIGLWSATSACCNDPNKVDLTDPIVDQLCSN